VSKSIYTGTPIQSKNDISIQNERIIIIIIIIIIIVIINFLVAQSAIPGGSKGLFF
jgi:hypothetical protein